MRKGVQLLLENGTIKVSSNRDDYRGINVIEDCLAETVSDDEYVSADEFFSSDEDMFSNNDSVMSKYSEEGVNVIVSCFGVPAPIDIEYHSKPVIAPVVICLPGLVPYELDKVVPCKYNATILEDGVKVPIQPLSDVKNITEASRVTRTGRIFSLVIRGNVNADKKVVESTEPKKAVGESSGTTLDRLQDRRSIFIDSIKDIYSSLANELFCP